MSLEDTDNVITSPAPTAAYPQTDGIRRIREFALQYYDKLTKEPQNAWRNYTDDAQYLHVEGDNIPDVVDSWMLTPAVGHDQINSNIVYQQFTECQFHIRTIDVQRMSSTDRDAYLALVTGDMERNRSPPVMFIQSLLIVIMQDMDGHVITNSILKVYTEDT